MAYVPSPGRNTGAAARVVRANRAKPQAKTVPTAIVKSKTLADGTTIDYGINPHAKPGASKKLPIPGGSVKPTKGVVKPPPKPATGMAGLFGGLGPEAYVSQLYAPQQQLLQTQQAQRSAGLKTLVDSFLAALKQPGADAYGAAAQDATGAANAAAATLNSVNPNAVTQANLAAINAPQAQRDAVGGQNQTVFAGGGAALQGLGAQQAGLFGADAQARGDFLKSLPAIVGSQAIFGAGNLANTAAKENTDFTTQKMQALQQARTDLASYVQKNQDFKLQLQKLADDESNTRFNQGATTTRLSQGQQRLDLQSQMDAFNQKYKINTYNLSVDRLNLASTKFSRSVLQSDRSYKIALQSLGLRTEAAQRKAIADEYKLQNGGFTPSKIADFKGDAAAIAQNTLNGFTDKNNKKHPPLKFGQALSEMRKGSGNGSIPLSIALTQMRQAGWKIPKKYDSIAGGLGQQADPFGSRSLQGRVSVAPGADRSGVSISPAVTGFVAQVAGVYGKPLTITTGTNHNEFVVNTHRESDHWTGHAADIAMGNSNSRGTFGPSNVNPELTRLGQAALIAAGADPAWARRQTAGLFNVGGKQIIFNSYEGGNHFNHLHVGVR